MAAYDDNQDGKIEIREVSIINHTTFFGTGTCQIIHQQPFILFLLYSKAGIDDNKKNLAKSQMKI